MKKTVMFWLMFPASGLAMNFDLVPEVTTVSTTSTTGYPFNIEIKSQAGIQGYRQQSNVSIARLSARLFGQYAYNEQIGILINSRLRSQLTDQHRYHIEDDSHLDIQELALNYVVTPQWRISAGRINIRNGVASGFNPTDWFKANSLVLADTLDVNDRREDRLGVVVVEGFWLGENSLFNLGYRPDFSVKTGTLGSNQRLAGLSLDRTNSEHSLFVKYTPTHWQNWSLTVSGIYQQPLSGFGMELSYALNDQWVIYNEWMGQYRVSLLESDSDASRSLYQQNALGVTWSLPEQLAGQQDISLSLEYHYNQAGLTRRQLRAWRATPDFSRLARLSGQYQEPLAAHQMFGRVTWNDVIGDSDLSWISNYSVMDGSGFSQLTWSLPFNSASRVESQVYHYFGGRSSVYGSANKTQGIMASWIYNF